MEKRCVGWPVHRIHPMGKPAPEIPFGVYPLYAGSEARALIRHAVETMGKKRVAVAYLNDEYGKNGLKGAVEELKARGMETVAQVPVEKNDTDLKPHVMELRKAKADMVLLWTTVGHAVRFVGTAKAMKFAPVHEHQYLLGFPLMIHISKGLWEGVICTTFGDSRIQTIPGWSNEEVFGGFGQG